MILFIVEYYGAWLRNNEVKKINCLSTHPNWMSQRKETIGNLSIPELFLPGTHNSGSYKKDLSESVVDRYTVTQVNLNNQIL